MLYPVSSMVTICRIMVKCQFYNFYLVLFYIDIHIYTHIRFLAEVLSQTTVQYNFQDVEIDSQDTESLWHQDSSCVPLQLLGPFPLSPSTSHPVLSLHVISRICYKMNRKVCTFDIGVFSQHIFL